MAKVATRGPLMPAPKPLLFSGSMDGVSSGGSSKGTNAIRRKTPAELRGEQLKRKNIVEIVDESPAPEIGSMMNANGVTSELTKPSKNPRYINTRVDEVFPSRKNSLRLKMLSGKEHVKENTTVDYTDGLKNSSFSLKKPESSSEKDTNASTSTTCPKNFTSSQSQTNKCSNNTFRSIMDLYSGGDKSSGVSLDMDEAFKGLAARDPPIVPPSHNEPIDGNSNSLSLNFCSEFQVPDQKIPLDFTLKTSMRVTASSSVSWFHRLMSCETFNSLGQFNSQVGLPADQKSKSNCTIAQISDTKSIYSWVYPQCSLPPTVISALTLTSKGEGQMDFLSKRQLAWEASFRSLYIMLRKNICNLFYVCTGQFVAMFTNANGACNGYISQSTQSLRSLLKEQDISFTMPLCNSKVEQATKEDLFELSEIEKHNLGKTRRTTSLFDVDNSPESLLMFTDKNNVHGLYDFLLNYRFLLPSLNTLDVPLLYSPVPFANAAISTPEVKCKEVRKIDHISVSNKSESNASYYTIEIKDSYLPPWIISSVCDVMKSNGDDTFEASFVIEPMSIGLNIGVEGVHEESWPFGVVCDELSRGFLKGLKYSDESYMASLSPV
ncbi:hypothetical protein L2E82_05484 [Cichorium intybus]|uniref:Uncharacterized protein n=1 Tax=Cichorium intybus TaxID=13427 RepID=A0ACB9H7B3_CICIN|nr:hypothetical protein L2E82_05484 [Cichorium intybus]